jgi:hypothetical protein
MMHNLCWLLFAFAAMFLFSYSISAEMKGGKK